jgi:branched-chain amino acid transport system permease protein
MLLQLIIQGLAVGSVYSLVALGFVLIYKASRVINFAQGELLMVGAYVCLHLMVAYKLPIWGAFALTFVFAMALGFLLERLVLRPMIGEPVISTIMVTIGLASVAKSVVAAIWGTENQVFPRLFSEEPILLGDLVISRAHVWMFAAALGLLGVFTLLFKYSRWGIAMRATAENQQVAMSMGISVRRVFALSWAIAAIVAAIGGILLGNIIDINPSIGFIGLKVFPAVILGGLDSIGGAVLGGLIIGILENLSGGYLDPLVGGGVKDVAPFVFLVIILMIKPYGLFGTQKIERV